MNNLNNSSKLRIVSDYLDFVVENFFCPAKKLSKGQFINYWKQAKNCFSLYLVYEKSVLAV